MEFSRQESWSGLPFSPPGDLSDPGIEPASPALVGRFFTLEPPGITHFLGEVAQSCPTLCDPVDCSPPGSSVHWISQERIPEQGCHFFLQGIFLTQGLNLYLLHWQTDSLPRSHLGDRCKKGWVSGYCDMVCRPPFRIKVLPS